MHTDVTDQPGNTRYELTADGAAAGHVEYHLHRDLIALLHTEIDPAYAGQGLGSKLIRGVLDDARQRDFKVQPFCSFVRGFIAKHPDYLDLVATEDRERFAL